MHSPPIARRVFTVVAAGLVAGLLTARTASAGPIVALYSPANQSIGTVTSMMPNGTTIDIFETLTAPGLGFLEFSRLRARVNYTINVHMINDSGVPWSSFDFEVLAPGHDGDESLDPNPQPRYVPKGFTTSNTQDGLSFAQSAGLKRSSSAFSMVFADEDTNAHDLLRFSNGHVGASGSATFTFGLRDHPGRRTFLLAQGGNGLSASPEPASLLLLGTGLFGLALIARRGLFGSHA